MRTLKKHWKASGNRQATLPFAKENPSVSQLEMAKPVMQFAYNSTSAILPSQEDVIT